MKPQYLGEFEYTVLLAVLQLEDAYAVPIRSLLEERTGRPVARGALYTALERLETKGCLRSRMADPTDDRGGKARRYFAVTPAGLRALKATHDAFASLTRGLETHSGPAMSLRLGSEQASGPGFSLRSFATGSRLAWQTFLEGSVLAGMAVVLALPVAWRSSESLAPRFLRP